MAMFLRLLTYVRPYWPRVTIGIATICIFGAILFSLSWQLALITLAPLPIYSILILIYNKKIRPFYTMARERIADISALLQDNLSGIRVIKCFAREDHDLHAARRSGR